MSMISTAIPTMIRRFVTSREGASAAETAAGNATRRSRRSRPALEALEGRALLSGFGSERLVSHNPQATNNFGSDNASSSNGTSVAVWVNAYSASDHDIWAQRFDKNHNEIGGPIKVDYLASDNSYDPHVSMDAQGRFVVTWENYDPHGINVLMRYYDSSGSPLTGITPVTASVFTNFNPDVAASTGSFVISWTHKGVGYDIYAEKFLISGGVPSGQGIFAVTNDTIVKDASSVAMSPNGWFDIAYERQYSGNDWDIYAYQNNGVMARTVDINSDTSPEFNPSVSMDNAGNAVVAYQRFIEGDYGIYANRLTFGNSPVGPMITVRDFGGINETDPSVALAPTGGKFVVAYDTENGVQVTEMGSNNVPKVTLGPVTGYNSAISIAGADHFVVTYTRFDSSTGHDDIFSRDDTLS
jgi:hypothetical protein